MSGERVKPEVHVGGTTAARDAWVLGDRKAKSDLILAISLSELKQVRNCITAREVWMKLESVYASQGPARKATLLKSLTLMRMQEEDDVREHIAKFFDAVDKLADMSVDINEDLLAIMLLYSLPASFENFRCAIETRDVLPNAEVLKIKIIEESDARQANTVSTPGAMAASRRGWKQSKRSTKNEREGENEASQGKFKFRCYRCHKEGHKSSECPNEGVGSKQYANSVDDTFVAYTGVAINKSEANYSAARGDVCKSWILDSGCTAHLCGDKDRFEWVSDSIGGKLNLASNASTNVEGKGIVRVSAANDQGNKLVEFRETLFVPDLRANLISVSKITSCGHKVIFDGNVAVVTN